jgi:hypothetical protein
MSGVIKKMGKELRADIVIVGGGVGGCAAALAAANMGKRVIMTEETSWIGGQLTSQAVPPDEHPWIEQFGCTKTYRHFRNQVREYYRRNYPLTEEARRTEYFNPGNAWVSRLSHEPRVALAILYEMLVPYLSNGRLMILTKYKAVSAETDGDDIRSVTVRQMETGDRLILTGGCFLDGTECGDILPLANVEYTTGAESQMETGEPHAHQDKADPQDVQSMTHVLAAEYIDGEDHTIEKPEQYGFWKRYQADFLDHRQLSWYGPDADTGKSKEFAMFPGEGISLWDYRRIIDSALYEKGTYNGDITLINWPQNDYWLGSIIDVSDEEKERHLKGAKQLSLSLFYWLQTEAPRPDGGIGYPGLRLRKDIVGTDDGLAMHPYIRESRRIKAEFTVVEQYINAEIRGGKRIASFPDTIGVGCYRIDLHPTVVSHQLFYTPSLPFEIPLGSLLPVRVNNLLPACKNIGATHITNGCFRVHPVEWNIGETVGYLAAYSLDKGVIPRVVRHRESLLKSFQGLLRKEGIELNWPKVSVV